MKLLPLLIVLCSFAVFAAPDRYWQVILSDQYDAQYWRTTVSGNITQVYDACEKDRLLGSAKTTGPSSWSLSIDSQILDASIDEDGRLVLTLGGKKLGSGQRIAKPTCEEGKPKNIVMIDVTQGERSFAATTVTGDALHLEQAVGVSLPAARVPAPVAYVIPENGQLLPNGQKIECSAAVEKSSTIRGLLNMPIFDSDAGIWPGALLQGKPFSKGQIVPIKIARAAGTIWMMGANLDEDLPLSERVKTMTESDTKAAVAKLASQKPTSLESSFDYTTEVVFNNDQSAYNLGADGRFFPEKSDFGIDQTNRQFYVLARFRQTFYNVTLEPPASRFSVFADKANLKDPNNEMGADNPPLLVTNVSYGRSIYIWVRSPYDGNAIAAALAAAGDNRPDAPITVSGQQLTYSKILQDPYTIFYPKIRGVSDPVLANQILNLNTSPNKFAALKNILQLVKSKLISTADKGVPIKYTVSYLSNRATATMGFATAYARRSCGTALPGHASFRLNLFSNHCAEISLIGQNKQVVPVYKGSSAPRSFNLDDYLPDNQREGSFTVSIKANGVCGPAFQFIRSQAVSGHNKFALLNNNSQWVDGNSSGVTPEQWNTYANTGAFPKPTQYNSVNTILAGFKSFDYRIQFNTQTGEAKVIQGY